MSCATGIECESSTELMSNIMSVSNDLSRMSFATGRDLHTKCDIISLDESIIS